MMLQGYSLLLVVGLHAVIASEILVQPEQIHIAYGGRWWKHNL